MRNEESASDSFQKRNPSRGSAFLLDGFFYIDERHNSLQKVTCMFSSDRFFVPIAFFVLPFVLLSCASSETVTVTDLNQLTVSVEEPNSESKNYSLQISGFPIEESDQYDVALSRLNNHEWDDILSIEESNSTQERMILVEIKNDPQSYNRVLWALGSEHFQNHATDYENPKASGTDNFKMPQLIGGLQALMDEVRYPDGLSDIEGKVTVEFIVNRFGEVKEPFITQSIHYEADREVIRAVNLMKFSPGVLDGLPVEVKYTLPVFFRSQ